MSTKTNEALRALLKAADDLVLAVDRNYNVLLFRHGLNKALREYRAALAEAPAPAGETVECAANGTQGCVVRPDGPNGELQCAYCGEPAPSAAGDAVAGEIRRDELGDLYELISGLDDHVFLRRYANDDRDWMHVADWEAMQRITTPPRAEAGQPAGDAEKHATLLWQIESDPIIEFDDDERAAIRAGMDAIRALAALAPAAPGGEA